MKTLLKASRVLTVPCLLSTTLLAADSPFAGTWKLNTSHSKCQAAKEGTLTWEPVGDHWKRTIVGVDRDGNNFNHIGPTIMWDGKDHATEKPGITVAITLVNSHTQSVIVKQDGTVVDSGKSVISDDGKTLTEIHNSGSVCEYERVRK